jgi:hypothetical protein
MKIVLQLFMSLSLFAGLCGCSSNTNSSEGNQNMITAPADSGANNSKAAKGPRIPPPKK